VSFVGGGSDLPAFYRKNGGAVLSTTIDKYMFIAINSSFEAKKTQLKYSRTELVDDINNIKHPIFREALKFYNVSGVELCSIADIPSGNGLGSSSSFTVGLLLAINAYQGKSLTSEQLASLACHIEMERLEEPIGKQDQYAAAYGGLNFITFRPDETVNVEKISMSDEKKKELEDNLLLVYVGGGRSASVILQQQSQNLSLSDKFVAQQQIVALAYNLRDALQANNLDDFGRILHENWLLKKTLATNISSEHINSIYEQGIAAGASGGKLLGAGGGGFILFYCPKEKQEKFCEAMKPYHRTPFKFDNSGSRIIYSQENSCHGF